MNTMSLDKAVWIDRLQPFGQEQLLRFWDELNE
jgi:hypothetical protein